MIDEAEERLRSCHTPERRPRHSGLDVGREGRRAACRHTVGREPQQAPAKYTLPQLTVHPPLASQELLQCGPRVPLLLSLAAGVRVNVVHASHGTHPQDQPPPIPGAASAGRGVSLDRALGLTRTEWDTDDWRGAPWEHGPACAEPREGCRSMPSASRLTGGCVIGCMCMVVRSVYHRCSPRRRKNRVPRGTR